MSFAGNIEFKENNIDDLKIYLRDLQPLSEYLSEIDFNIWEFVILCIIETSDDIDEDSTFIDSYKCDKVELYKDKILIYFNKVKGETGYYIEPKNADYHSYIDQQNAIFKYDLISGNLIDLLDRKIDKDQVKIMFESNLNWQKNYTGSKDLEDAFNELDDDESQYIF